MSHLSTSVVPIAEKMELVLMEGDLAKLSPEERVSYYNRVTSSLGLNPLTRPFDYIRLNNKLVLYAKKDATDQLRKIYGVSIIDLRTYEARDVYGVIVKARDKHGREDTATGVVNIAKLTGDALANAMMKAETKAKRRVTLSICGLGMLDETEIETIPDAKPVTVKEPVQLTPPSDFAPSEDFDTPAPAPAGGDYIVPIGKKYRGQRLKDIPPHDLRGFVEWLMNSAEQKGEPLSGAAAEFVDAAEAYLSSLEG